MSPAPSMASAMSLTSLLVPSPHACTSASLRTQKPAIVVGSTAAVRASEMPTAEGSHAPDPAVADDPVAPPPESGVDVEGGGVPWGAPPLPSSLHARVHARARPAMTTPMPGIEAPGVEATGIERVERRR